MVDLTILGGGAAGSRTAMLAAKAGFSVVLIECGASGGGAVNEGFWPYRGMLSDAADVMRGREGFLGLRMLSESHIYSAMLKHMRAEVDALAASQAETLKTLGAETVCSAGCVEGLRRGRYIVKAGGTDYESRRLMLCPGSMPLIPDLPDIERFISDEFVITPKELLYQKLPERAVVEGGGIRSLQMAAWLAANRVRTALVCPGQSIAAELDKDVAEWLKNNIKGIDFVTNAGISALKPEHAVLSINGMERAARCDKVVIGGRRRPATRGIGLDNTGVSLKNGAIVTDSTCQTNLPDVYAAGDVNMRSLSAIGAFREAEVSVSNMMGRKANMRYDAVPRIFMCGAAGASVGETEESAGAGGHRFSCVKESIRGSGRNGFVKVLADEKGRVLGAHMCGYGDTGVIWELSACIENNADITEAARYICPRTDAAEAVQRALLRL